MRFSRKLATAAVAAMAFTGLSAPLASAVTMDTDGDKLLDVWETNGYDYNNDGVIDIDFAAMGADPYRKDLFVEMDYMPGLLASEAELGTIVQTFADMPVWNPNGTTGITIHLDAGSIYPAYDLGGGNEVPHQGLSGLGDVNTLRGANSDPARAGVFHYMVWGDYYGTSGSSGSGYYPGRTFLVTVGPTHWGKASSAIRVGTFIHELGHNLGLNHGGTDGTNYKLNYTSIMNYKYQLEGVRRTDGAVYYGYSTRAGMTIDETAVVESKGAGNAARGFSIHYGNRYWNAHQGIDFDQDGVVETTAQQIDVNRDGTIGKLTAPNDLMTLKFQAQSSAPGISPYEQQEPEIENNEMTADLARQLGYLPAE